MTLKYSDIPSIPVKVRPRKGANCWRPCSWIMGAGWVVKVEVMVEIGLGVTRVVRRDWIGSINVDRGVISRINDREGL